MAFLSRVRSLSRQRGSQERGFLTEVVSVVAVATVVSSGTSGGSPITREVPSSVGRATALVGEGVSQPVSASFTSVASSLIHESATGAAVVTATLDTVA